MDVVRVGGVPEHFNLPWHIGIDKNIFEKHDVKVEWQEQKLGTGAMVASLLSGECDIVVALTEGLVAEMCRSQVRAASEKKQKLPQHEEKREQEDAAAAGPSTEKQLNELKLVGGYVSSPLCWAISVGKESGVKTVEDLRGAKWGISKEGSGSHLMPQLLAKDREWEEGVSFHAAGSFANLRHSVNAGETKAFMWEKFMTKPYHDAGEINPVGFYQPPWPAFLMASSSSFLAKPHSAHAIRRLYQGLREALVEFGDEGSVLPLLTQKFHLSMEDAKQWYAGVRIDVTTTVPRKLLESVVDSLVHAAAIPEHGYAVDDFVEPSLLSLSEEPNPFGAKSSTS